MWKDSMTGTPDQLRDHITKLKLPSELPEHEAIRAFILANVPTYGATKWQYSVSAESACNQGGTRMAGYLSVACMEV